MALASFLAVVTAFGTAVDMPAPLVTQPIDRLVAPQIAILAGEARPQYLHEDRFQRGDTLATLFDRLGIDELETQRLLATHQAMDRLRLLRPGTAVRARTEADGQLLELSFLAPNDQIISIQPQSGGGGFVGHEQPARLTPDVQMKSGEIRSSLFAATDSANIPDAVATQLAEVFAGDIDFHRDLRKGDTFTVVYEMLGYEGRQIRPGRLLAAEFINQQKSYRAVWFQDAPGKGGYYTPSGKSLRKAFLRSPLEFSRVTSGFSMRLHPILKQWRAHTGVDYGAPTGTHVKATADGVVEFAGQQTGYGNVVILRHGNGVTTLYGHLSAFAKGLKVGTRVSQNDVIAYVGQTGWATGPHLHYEFRINGQYHNPLTVALPTQEPLTPDRMAAFRAATLQFTQRLDLLRNTNLALLE